MIFEDLSGQRFGRWLAIKRVKSKHGYRTYLCVCDCGNTSEIVSSSLRKGDSLSCGCWSKEYKRELYTTHGMKKHPLYSVWRGMKNRCYNKNDLPYKDYGGRGIKLSDKWLSNFMNFYNDMSPTYQKGLTIERIDVNGNYEKSNCCWITRSKQARNRRCSRWIETLEGRMTITEAANKVGISYLAMFRRVKMKWPIEKLLIPANFKQRVVSYPKNVKRKQWTTE